MLKRYIGDRAFYRRVLAIVVPIIIQNGITNFVSLLDNIMVGQVGTLPMSGVSIVNQLLFVFYLCIFGATAGAGIFTAQFQGSGDNEGIRHTFRFKILICTALAIVGMGIFFLGDEPLIRLFLTGEGAQEDAAAILEYGRQYLKMMLPGLLPFAITSAYAGTLKETGETFIPMLAGIVATLVNLVLNYVLIFGHFGAPEMGVEGAALATVISRFAELAIVAGWTHLHTEKNPFILGAYRSMAIPAGLLKSITVKGMPLLANELLWSSGMTFLNQCYSTCGLDVVPALNITSTLFNLTSVVFMSMGAADGILMGQMLGASAPAEAVKDSSRKLIAISVFSGLLFGLVTIALSGAFPHIYNTSHAVRSLATRLILICALFMPFDAFANAAYFILRSGGQTYITFLFDSGFVWAVMVPLGYVLSRFTGITILPLYFLCQSTNILKAAVGSFFLGKGKWIQNLAVKNG